MPLNAQRLAKAMHDGFNAVSVDQATINRMGDRIYDLIMQVQMDQASDPDGNLGRERSRKTAQAIIELIFNAAGATSYNRFLKMATAIVSEFQTNADVKALHVNVVMGGNPEHTHPGSFTSQTTGKIG